MGIESFPAPNASRLIGEVIDYAGVDTPAFWLDCWAQSVLRANYPALFGALTKTIGTFTVTIASPGVFTCNAHGLVVGDTVYFTTTGALPTGLNSDFGYTVSSVTTNTFQVTSLGYTYNAATASLTPGASQNTSGSQSGTHTLVKAPYGVQDSTHFSLPDGRNRGSLGLGSPSVGIKAQGAVYGETAHTLLSTESGQPAGTALGVMATGAGGITGPTNAVPPHNGVSSGTAFQAGIAAASAAAAHNTQDPITIYRKIIYAGA